MRAAAFLSALAVCTLSASLPPDAATPLRARRWTASDEALPARAAFSVRVADVVVPLRVMALGVSPHQEVEIAKVSATGGALEAEGGDGRLERAGVNRWTWVAPARPGLHAVRVISSQPRDTIDITLMVLKPITDVQNGVLGGYPIGAYRARRSSMSGVYEPPRGFVEARSADYEVLVSPNFRLGDFLCKQPGEPRYLLVSPALLIKLESLLMAVNAAGHETSRLTVMSGFRTPAYNRAIGNTTEFSRHLWGDAADVYVDNDRDGEMDDLNGDGRSDLGDARWLARLVERMMGQQARGHLAPGGLAVYRRNAAHGPFVHVDARGHRARW